jgi:ABC-type Fe3+ transport system substrate-binding protein
MDFKELRELDFLGLMPCPLQITFEKLFTEYTEHFYKKTGFRLSGLVVSNANNQIDFFSQIETATSIEDYPAIVMAPGFNYFYHRGFMNKYKNEFISIGPLASNPELKVAQLQDPMGNYYIPCFNPTVMIVDRTLHPDLPIPHKWGDLLKPEYAGQIALRGHQDGNFCEGTLLNIYRDYGIAGIEKLGKAVKIGLHPSQMVKFAGSGKPEAPVISGVPYFFSRAVKTSPLVSIVWPEDGAIANPFVMLVKKSALPRLQNLCEFITSSEIGQVFADSFFPCPHPSVKNNLPPEASLKWLGWDFITSNDLGKLVPMVQQVFLNNYRGGQHHESGHSRGSAVLGEDGCHNQGGAGHHGRGHQCGHHQT